MNIWQNFSIASAFILTFTSGYAHAADYPTKFTNTGSIANTRHNLTQQPLPGGSTGTINASAMDTARNNYGEVCVYCHTPHGANTTVAAPLWNRTIKATTYTTYNELGTSTLTQTVSQPGAASLACLSCHDGQTAIDSIVNMPGSGRYQASQATTQDNTFLSTWNNASGTNPTNHAKVSDKTVDITAGDSCLGCHKSAPGVTDFSVFAIGTDLRNDHPVGVTFPSANGAGTDFKTPGGTKGTAKYFDTNGNSKMDSSDIRLYDTAGTVQVECASCHDPHGVPTAGPGTVFKKSFLRVDNTGSALCLTCHSK